MHPIIRVHIIQNGMILLRKRPADDLFYPCHWDTAISNHIRLGETVENCIKRTAQDLYGLTEFKSFFLSNYTTRTDFEQHYAFLFIACKMNKLDLQSEKVKQGKWWTQQAN
jgi:isopentenyldiphosphate isomerase